MKIRQRKFLVMLLVTSQLGCMLFGLALAAGWLHRAVTEMLEARVAAEGRSLVHELAAKTSSISADSVEPGTPWWEELQSLVESIQVPHDGFATAIRYDTGALVCHSALREDPELLRLFPGRVFVEMNGEVAPLTSAMQAAVEQGDHLLAGKIMFDGQLQRMTAYALPRMNAVLAIHQSDEAVENAIAEMVYPVAEVGCLLTALMIGAACLLTIFIVNRYEKSLALVNAGLEQEVSKRTRSLIRTRDAVICGLAKLAESRDKDTGSHIDRIRSYVTILATELARTRPEIDHEYVSDLVVASALHDIGKVGIPDSLLLKRGGLTPSERQAVELHTVLGSECLGAIQEQSSDDDFLRIAQQIAAAHHERWDGTGYPLGLQGKQIPLPARIVALADVYDALTSQRPYKDGMSHVEAREWIVEHYETQFDPETVEAFIAREADFARVSQAAKEAAAAASFDAAAYADSGEGAASQAPADAGEVEA